MIPKRYLLGCDVGSSSIKVSLLDAESGKLVASAASPATEMTIMAKKPGWAEQDPDDWWRHLVLAAHAVMGKAGKAAGEVGAIGISYQMHGLVLVDKGRRPLRPSIIWCDGRAVEIGDRAFREIGGGACLSRLLNSPGNFTASRLAWVKENEPGLFRQVYKAMLPGDYIAMRMTGDIHTTASGLSEYILWDFSRGSLADIVMDYFSLDPALLPDAVPTFSNQGSLTSEASSELGLPKGIPVSYRAGDQPNNAFSLNVLDPGAAAATAGTSGVVYGVADVPSADSRSRVNTFVHVTHGEGSPRYGVLLCVGGTGILYSWIRRNLMGREKGPSYDEMNALALKAPVGSDGLVVLPFGNGAERTLDNRNIGSSMIGLDFNRHGIEHVLRAAQEGIVFALCDGLSIMRGMGMDVKTVRAGHANMFLSPLFAETFASATGARVELYDTDGSQGAARGAGLGAGIFPDAAAAFHGLSAVAAIEPRPELAGAYQEAHARWGKALNGLLGG